MFIKQDYDRKSKNPNIPPILRIIHPISHDAIWFGDVT